MVRRKEDPVRLLMRYDERRLFIIIGVLLVLRGVLALLNLIIENPEGYEPIYVNPQLSVVVYLSFLFGGLGLYLKRSWGVILAEAALVAAFIVDVVQPSPRWFIDLSGLVLIVALLGPLKKLMFKD